MTKVAIQLPANIEGKFNIALTESNFNKLSLLADSLVYNEDHLADINDLLTNIRKVNKNIDEAHKLGKAQALAVCQQWDSAKRTYLAMINPVLEKVQGKYTAICFEVEERQRRSEIERQRVESIRKGIENNAINFSQQIANCKTNSELISIERMINLEKSRKEKYQEFIEDATNRFTELNSLLADQKVRVKELEAIEKEAEEAKQKGDDESYLELLGRKEETESLIEEAGIFVQETAINQAVNEDIQVAEEIFPTIKARRTAWTWEVADMKEVAKKMPSWVEMITVDKKIDDYLSAKRGEGVKEEFTFAGIRFYQKKTF